MEKTVLRNLAIGRSKEKKSARKKDLNISKYYGELVFNYQHSPIDRDAKDRLASISRTGEMLDRDLAEIVAKEVLSWAVKKGATHFCHWFQPLTGGTAEKHDSFLSLDKNKRPLET
ncbi:MAG: glutamine synthetase III, partial [Halobacteriovoraceae bacterium]|nr:glutamine synthetase III [Halobacteriovoraceae bacterium]